MVADISMFDGHHVLTEITNICWQCVYNVYWDATSNYAIRV